MNSAAPSMRSPASSAILAEGLLRLRCPMCFEAGGAIDPADVSLRPLCPSCGFVFYNQNGIWRALLPEREEYFRRFIRDYESVRSQEGRGSTRPAFYLALPFEDLTGRHRAPWKIRARSFTFFERNLLPPIEAQSGRPLDELDIGAGNGWLSFRLAWRGHRPVAVDLVVNDEDGLGAAQHYFPCLKAPFPRFQAEMDRLPFADGQFDLAIFNASFHYSADYVITLRETLRVLRRPGHVLIIDSPSYERDESGKQMVEEKRAQFEKKFGLRSDSIRCREYLTPAALDELAGACGVTWTTLKPWYGVRWALRPLGARLRGRRAPSSFFIFQATVTHP